MKISIQGATMIFHKRIRTYSLTLILASTSVFAATTEQVQVPLCLAAALDNAYPVLAESQEFKILNIPSQDMTKLALTADKSSCGRFVNVSHYFSAFDPLAIKAKASEILAKKPTVPKLTDATYKIQYTDEVQEALSLIESSNIIKNLTRMTQFRNRSATKQTGANAAKWLQSTFEAYASGHSDVTTYFVNTGKYKQPSFVAVLGEDIKAPAVVIGAHIDTLDGVMPGADDDGSGAMTVMEAARVILSSPVKFKHPIYFVWYAAEEVGLVGSQYVVKDFANKGIKVKAVAQFDMTGYRSSPNDPTIWVYRDYTDRKLSNFLAELVENYVAVPVGDSECGYGCSDHASWTDVGIPAVFPSETDFENHNKTIHTSQDTMNRLSLDHMVNFTKLAIAFVIELAEVAV